MLFLLHSSFHHPTTTDRPFKTVRRCNDLLSLTIGLGGIVTLVDDQILRSVVFPSREVALQDGLGACGVSFLGIDGGSGHVRNHGVAASPWVLGSSEWVVTGCVLREPDVTSVSVELTGLEGLGDILLDDNGATSGVDEPSTCREKLLLAAETKNRERETGNMGCHGGIHTLLHLAENLLVEETSGLLVKRAVDGDNVTLAQELVKVLDSSAANLLLNLRLQGLVIEVKQLLAVEGLEAAEDTLSDTANSDGTDDLVLEIELVLGDGSDVPFTSLDLLVSGNEVADKGEDGHDNVLSDGGDVAASNFGNGDTSIGLVGGVEVNVIRTNTGGDCDLEVLGFGKTLCGQVTRVETEKDWKISTCL